jgi:hypothetical protein
LTVGADSETVDSDILTDDTDDETVGHDCRGGGSSPPAERSEK